MIIRIAFLGMVLTAAGVGTASASALGSDTGPQRAVGASSASLSGCDVDTRGWPPRTLKVGEGHGRPSGATTGTEETFERGSAVRDCAVA